MSARPGNPGNKATPSQRKNPAVPPATRPTRVSRPALALWLVAASLAALFIPLYLLANAVTADVKELEKDLSALRVKLTAVPTPAPEIAKLLTPLAEAQAQATRLGGVVPTLTARVNLPAAMSAAADYDTSQIILTGISRTDNRLLISGLAVNNQAVMDYAKRLEQSQQFSSVMIQSLAIVSAQPLTPTLAATATLAPTATGTATLAPTATPEQRDAFEPDDVQAKPIPLGQPQTHSFLPAGDVDTASFLAKSLRYYRISTGSLAPGVDTILTVRVGGFVYMNDDAAVGRQDSEVVFQNYGLDADAVITVANRGQFGADKTYVLTVEEIAAPPPATPQAQNPGLLFVGSASTLNGIVSALEGWRTERDTSCLADPMTVEFVIIAEMIPAAR